MKAVLVIHFASPKGMVVMMVGSMANAQVVHEITVAMA